MGEFLHSAVLPFCRYVVLPFCRSVLGPRSRSLTLLTAAPPNRYAVFEGLSVVDSALRTAEFAFVCDQVLQAPVIKTRHRLTPLPAMQRHATRS